MKFSAIWLNEWIDSSVEYMKLIHPLTMSGFMINEIQSISNFFYGIVIGQIVECKNHPDFHHLWIIKVDNGGKNLINIVCNAHNCRKNLKVVVANIGALLPNKKRVKLTTIQGCLSEGLLCTFSKLNIFDYVENGIIELPHDAPIGEDFYHYLDFNDKIIDININPNRGDCLSIFGMAREIAAINNKKLKKITIQKIKPTVNDVFSIYIQKPELCPQYLARILKNINIKIPTPLWIKEKLRRCGINLFNIAIDIVNYVSLELGQPIQIFDYNMINGNIIKIRFSKNGEVINFSNKKNIKLFPKTLIISDEKIPISIAGVIENQSTVHHTTKNIILQCAFFNPSLMIKQLKLYNFNNLSAMRYARGIDPNMSYIALEYVTSLLSQNCCGDPGPIIDLTQQDVLPQSNSIILNQSKLKKVLGINITKQKIICILKNLGCQIEIINCFTWKILNPSWRYDIYIEENLIAEIIRVYGYKKLKNNFSIKNYHHKNQDLITISLFRIKNLLIDLGYQEIITYSFINPNKQKLLYPQEYSIPLHNPISLEMSVMRLTLWVGLIETMIYNQNRQKKNIQLFECGSCFFKSKEKSNSFYQKFMIAGLRSGFRSAEHWDITRKPVDFYDIKGDVESILRLTNKLNYVTFKKSQHPALQLGQSADIYLNQKIYIGNVGVIHPIIQRKLNLKSTTLVFELLWDAISSYKLPNIFNISKFPINYRDISMIIPNDISAESIINTCKKININTLIDVTLFDVYIGPNISKGYKSYTIRLSLQAKNRTLTEKEISDIIDKCLTILKKYYNVNFR